MAWSPRRRQPPFWVGSTTGDYANLKSPPRSRQHRAHRAAALFRSIVPPRASEPASQEPRTLGLSERAGRVIQVVFGGTAGPRRRSIVPVLAGPPVAASAWSKAKAAAVASSPSRPRGSTGVRAPKDVRRGLLVQPPSSSGARPPDREPSNTTSPRCHLPRPHRAARVAAAPREDGVERDLGLARGLGVGPGLQARLDAAPQRREALGAEPRRHLAREGGSTAARSA